MRDFSLVDAAIVETDPVDVALQRAIGPWAHLGPHHAAEILSGFRGDWWVVGGHAIEAFTRVQRQHHDLDVGFFRADLPALREHLGSAYDLWSVGSGLLRLIDDDFPDLHAESDQVWFRQHAWSPWLIDLLASPRDGDRWVHKRDPSLAAPLDQVTWTDQDGIRYLAPDLVLTMKAKARRPRDDADFQVTKDRLTEPARARLQDFLRRHHPQHPWLTALG